MAITTAQDSDAFLEGQGQQINLANLDAELSKLWGPAATRAGGPDIEQPTVTRIVLANLVVAGQPADFNHCAKVIDTVVARFPCRMILVRETEQTERKVRAEISAVCHLPAPGQPQVCSERIVLTSNAKSRDLVPGTIRSVLEPDIPMFLWWWGDPRPQGVLYHDLADESIRVILDLPDPGTPPEVLDFALANGQYQYGRDTAWCGITPWRELVCQHFDTAERQALLKRIDTLKVEAVAPNTESPSRAAAWLVGWLAGQLGWAPTGTPKRIGSSIDAWFHGPNGPVSTSIRSSLDSSLHASHIQTLTLSLQGQKGPETLRIHRPSPLTDQVQITTDSPHKWILPSVVTAPEMDAARRVAEALEAARFDPPAQRARPHVVWLLRQS